jgi:hypothetical protein
VEVPSKPRALGYQASADLGVQRRRHRGRRARAMQAAPLGGQCGGRRTPSAPLALEARGQMQGRLVLAHSRDGPRPRVGQERQRLPLRGVFLQAGARVLACRSVAPAQRGGLRNGPREVGVPDVFAGRAHACARRCLGTLDQTARGANRLPRRKAGKVVHVIEQHEAEELADTGDGLPQLPRVSVRVCGRLDASECAMAQPWVVIGAQGPVDCKTLGHGGSGTACRDALAGGGGGALRADLGPVIVTLGLVDRGPPCSACAPQVGAAASEVAGGAPRRRRDRGLGEQAAAQQRRPLVRIARVGFGLATVASLQRAGMPPHQGHPRFRTQSSEPGPGEETCDSHHETRTGRGDGLEQQVWSCLHMAVEHDRTSVLHATDIHGAGVHIDPTVQWVLVGGESPEVFSFVVRDVFLSSAYHWGMLRRRPQSFSQHCT